MLNGCLTPSSAGGWILLPWQCPECEGTNLNEDGTLCWDCSAADNADGPEESTEWGNRKESFD